MPKHIIITGANGNMGAAVAKKFLENDFHVIAVDHSGSHLGFTEGLSNFELHQVNLDEDETSRDFFNEIASLKGNIDAALLLVGGYTTGNIETTELSSIKQMFKLNFDTVYNAARPLFQHMLEKGYGRLVFVGARPALDPVAGKDSLAYALSKSLLFKLADFMNAEASSRNVMVSVIVPGILDTPINRQNMPGADTSTWIQPTEVAELCYGICTGGGKLMIV